MKIKDIAIAGIFDRFHEGHKYAIKQAFRYGKTLHILFLHTGDRFTHPDKRVDLVEPFDIRIKKVKTFIKSLGKENQIKYYGEDGRIGLPPVFGWEILRDYEELGWVQCKSDYKGYKPFAQTLDYIRTKAYRMPKLKFFWIEPLKNKEGKKISSSDMRMEGEKCKVEEAK